MADTENLTELQISTLLSTIPVNYRAIDGECDSRFMAKGRVASALARKGFAEKTVRYDYVGPKCPLRRVHTGWVLTDPGLAAFAEIAKSQKSDEK